MNYFKAYQFNNYIVLIAYIITNFTFLCLPYKGLKYILKSIGDRQRPCLRPFVVNGVVISFLSLIPVEFCS